MSATATEQLALFAPPRPPAPTDRMTPEQRAEFNALCARVRQEAEQATAIARELGYSVASVRELHGDDWAKVWGEFHRRHPDPKKVEATQIAREMGYSVASIDHLQKSDIEAWRWIWQVWHERKGKRSAGDRQQPIQTKSRQVRPYRPWSKHRKQAHSLRNLVQRLAKKFSIPTLYMERLQDELIKDPWRYGVCPLPSELGSFPSNVPRSEQLEAIAREVELRQQGR